MVAILSSIIVLFVLWLGLTLSFNHEELVLGAALSIIIAVTTRGAFTGNLLPLLHPRRFAAFWNYVVYFLYQMIRANLDVARRVLGFRPDINPGIVRAHVPIKSHRARVIIANSITLTPGTLSVDLSGDVLYIHWIGMPEGDAAQATQRMVNGFARRLEPIFA